ncbi:MAG TPA: tRNA uridine-5-carboxymethylaminomethyl(34) synthesis GTPase MnmE [Clostridiales bacterium]|nr:MAG: tRNA uridine-5-carboxymethylaminomethyl(34) synthesis GTPase MnmE [Clostridiales bacterium GWD2_32_19]HCC07574.1 tRNA uridine-5-carboxymethylaminomethyl(34) synthesis GTPase MnmE [Clostridiales bacterium]
MENSLTVAAISTPVGSGGISIIRISGENAFTIIKKIFVPKHTKDISEAKSHTIHFGIIADEGKTIDEVLVSVMKKPNTYTKEDIVEINCHGGIIPTQRVLDAVLKYGADLAEPGEFTKRAFLNGRLDLSQAESVIDLITAKTDLSRQSAVNQLEGSLSHKISALKNSVADLLSHIEVNIDYPEYDIEQLSIDTIETTVIQINTEIKSLLTTSDTGKIIREGISTAIVGKPNVGKSSLLNALIGEQRAIVTDIPGTTRDLIEEYVNLHGIPLKLVDTAGIRETEDVVEKIGVDLSRRAIDSAELILFILDNSSPISDEDISILERIKDKKHIIILNKSDLPEAIDFSILGDSINNVPIIKLSITQNTGLDDLEKTIKKIFMSGEIDVNNEVILTNVRHKNALNKAEESLSNVLTSIKLLHTQELLAIDLQNAYRYLGEITGESVSEDIIHSIFSRFCLGK